LDYGLDDGMRGPPSTSLETRLFVLGGSPTLSHRGGFTSRPEASWIFETMAGHDDGSDEVVILLIPGTPENAGEP
jgi:hypothetical protein